MTECPLDVALRRMEVRIEAIELAAVEREATPRCARRTPDAEDAAAHMGADDSIGDGRFRIRCTR
jgi:hypothetical protein